MVAILKHFKFHKVAYRHYSGKVETVYMILYQIYSGNGTPNFNRIARILQEILQKNMLVSFISKHSVYYSLQKVTQVLGLCIKTTAWQQNHAKTATTIKTRLVNEHRPVCL